MPIDIKTAGYQKRERVAAPLDVYNSTLNTLQQKHDTAIETSNQIKTFLANKQLNEAENEWVDNYSRNINAQIEASAQDGSYATALTTAKKLAGEVASNPGLIGRERYQQEFKKFQDEVTNSNAYDGDVKAYALEQNKYNYQDQVNETGKVIGGNQFQPNYRPVEQVDYNTLYQKVLSTVGVDSSSGEQLVWGDAEGNLKEGKGNIAAGDVPYLKTASGVQQLSADKIRAAFESALNETPGARASLEQDYKVNVWKANKGNKNNTVTRPDGTIMSQKEFEENLFAPRYAASAYRRVESRINPELGFNLLAASRKTAAKPNTGKEPDLLPSLSTPGYKEKVEPDTPAKVQSQLNTLNGQLSNMFSSYGISKSIPLDEAYSKLRSGIANNVTLSDTAKKQLLDEANTYYRGIANANNRLDAMKGHLTQEEQYASEFLGKRLSNGDMADTNNPMQLEYANRMTKLFTDSKGNSFDTVLVNPLNNSSKDAIISKLRTGMGLTNQDVSFSKIGDKEYIRISKDAYIRLAPEMADVLKLSPVGFTTGNNAPETFTRNDEVFYGNKVYGSLTAMGIAGFRAIGRGEITTAKSAKDSPAYVYEKAAQISNSATERISKTLPSNYVDNVVFDLPPHIIAAGQGLEDDQLKNYNERVMNMISIANPGSIVIKKRNAEGVLEPVEDSRERNAIMQTIQAQVKKKNINNGWTTSVSTGEYGVFVNIPYTAKTGKNSAKNPDSEMEERVQNAVAGDYVINGAILNDEIERFKSLPAVKAWDTLNSIKYNNALKRNYRLSDAEFGDGTYSAVTDGGSFYQILDANDEPVIKITEGELFQRMFQNNQANAILAPVKEDINLISARNGSIANSPIEEQQVIARPLMQKAMIMAGATGNLRELDIDTKRQVFQFFNRMYSGLTGESPSQAILNQMNDLMN
jgi:hypothetical protein